MRQSIKSICLAVLLFGVPTAIVVWLDDRPSTTVWMVRWISTLICIAAIGLLIKLQTRHDVAPDLLRRQVGQYFNRDGFCFGFGTKQIDGVIFLQAWFQNQFVHPCRGRIALRPSRGFFMNRPDIEAIAFDIDCPEGGFGVAATPIPVPGEFQGKKQRFDVGASVEYPQGKGTRLRFDDGLTLRSDAKFKNPFGTALTTTGALTGQIVMSKPATVTIELPTDAAVNLPDGVSPEVRIVWKVGDATG